MPGIYDRPGHLFFLPFTTFYYKIFVANRK